MCRWVSWLSCSPCSSSLISDQVVDTGSMCSACCSSPRLSLASPLASSRASATTGDGMVVRHHPRQHRGGCSIDARLPAYPVPATGQGAALALRHLQGPKLLLDN